MRDKIRALLLIGPSGSGKSPLGALLEKRMGWTHFDFGHQLRIVARGEEIPGLTEGERDYVKQMLSYHTLFPNEKFPIIEKILNYFLERNVHAPGIILNGVPRHVGQAMDLSNILDIERVAVLEYSEQTSIPLIDHYQSTGVQVVRISVESGTNESQIATQIIKSIR